jgi:hypothetical protein
MMNQKTIKDDIDKLEKLITKIKFEYEQYIRGNLKNPPSSLEREANSIIQTYNRTPPLNSTVRFRFNNLTARFISFRQKWERDLAIRDGFIKTPQMRQQEEAEPQKTTPETERRHELLSKLDELPKSYDKTKILAAVNDKINQLKSRGYTDIDVTLDIVDGKPKLRITTGK